MTTGELIALSMLIRRGAIDLSGEVQMLRDALKERLAARSRIHSK